MQQQADLDLPHIKCEGESICAGSFHSALGSFNDDLATSKVDLVINLNIEKPVKKRKMNKKNKKKRKSTKEVPDNIVSEMGQTKYGVSDAKSSQQSFKEEVDSPAMNCEKCLKNNIPSVSTTSLCAVNVNGRPEDPNIQSSNTSTCCNGLNMDRLWPKQSSPGCLIEVIQESLSSRNLSECKSCESTNIMLGNSKVSNSCHAATESNGFKCNNSASQLAVKKTRHQSHIMAGKENIHQVWAKSQRSVRELQKFGAKRLHCKYVEKDASLLQKNYLVKNNSFSGRGLLPNLLNTSSRHINTANVGGIRGTKTFAKIRSKAAVESSQCVAQQKLNRNLDQCASQPSQVSKYEPEECEALKLNLIPSIKAHNNFKSKKGQKSHEENYSRHQDKYCCSRKENLHVQHELNHYENGEVAQRICNSQHIVPHGAYYLHSSPASDYAQQSIPVQGGFQPYSGMNNVLRRSFHSSTDSEPYMRFNQFNEHMLRKGVTSGMNGKKWVPVDTKESRMLEKTDSVNICYVNNSDSSLLCKGDGDNHTAGNMIDHLESAVLSESKSTISTACDEMNSVESEVLKSESVSKVQNVERSKAKEVYAQKSEDNQQLFNGSQMVTQSLSAAYRKQLVSESVVASRPLADFERFLCAATPVIISSYAYENCSVCLHDQLSSCFLCKHQILNTSLCSLWKWYEEPGNYGLKVKTGDSQNLKGKLTESMSSHAYFVPYLSAIQLFGYSNLSNSHGLVKYSAVNFDSVEKPDISSKVLPCNADRFGSFISSPVCSSNRELVFQFFESADPHLRKPLYNKIVDLIDAGTSNLQVFGDPSQLQYLKLCDLHPASWFSVAWYPIYQIPDRKFHASFLTYHSLGHLVQTHVSTDSLDEKSFCVVSPVVGMQSYKAQGEGWFELNIPVKSFLNGSPVFNCSENLKEQLQTLEKNASIFACIYKDSNKEIQHPDYKFFTQNRYFGHVH
ncbi:hypothetical protein LWI28_022446 [Acer negundo]|uniref:Uncharacterized protein n=1 Tax=Acer negundo TaxID=4023 RepID=A0AAD5NT11_ACENE|nr:hypothetical protein LWI28_022446 [Acer negundo]KAK4845932.1 hypothetical protein QYF36_010867 [Acer negundo]